MRVTLVAVLVALPLVASAQSRSKDPDAAPKLPAIGQPLPQIGLPLPTIGLPPAEKPDRKTDKRPPAKPREPRGRGRGRNNRNPVYFVPVPVPVYGVDAAPTPEPPPPPPPSAPPPQTGVVSLDVDLDVPAQIFVDSYYVGTTDELGRDLTLDAGPRAIELRAPGRDPISVNVKVEPGRTIAYRAPRSVAAEATPAPPPAREAAAKPDARPLYVVPGCYIGNVPPKDAALPAGCDARKATTIRK